MLPSIETWFRARYGEPTPPQREAWPLIEQGKDVLIAAPTGSGKTLAAFLVCLSRLFEKSIRGELEEGIEVLYVSPLRALSNDIHRNLQDPLKDISEQLLADGHLHGLPRAMVRTGDTPAAERALSAKHPPHILVTTPESLYLMLTSGSGRKALSSVKTIILDEIHALAGDKRGAHLSLSVERLEALVAERGTRLQRVGLSATIRPMDLALRLLSGNGRPRAHLVDYGGMRAWDLGVEVPGSELGAVCSNEQWAELYEKLEEQTKTHKTTLVFVNTRRLVEKVAHQMEQRLGESLVAAHHGSMSKQRRFSTEQGLKAGQIKLVVATASLELGIDVGSVDLVAIIGSPRSISAALQRVGRAGHQVASVSKGRFYPLTRDQLVECAAIVRAAKQGKLDAVALRSWPLDVLAQQIVASVVAEPLHEDELFRRVKGAAPYAELSREAFDGVVELVSDGIETARGRVGALLHRDGVHHMLRPRKRARLVALMNAGAIPDTALYDVVLDPEGLRVGTVDEDFAVESMAGDVFLLGNTSWRVRRIEQGKVRVEDAGGAAPSIPFWLGEAPARSRDLSLVVGELREWVAGPEGTLATTEQLAEACGLSAAGALLVQDYIRAGRAALGAVPSAKTVVLERFFDEAGGTQIVLHAPFGGRINRAWGMALRKKFCRTFDFELQAAATDEGVLLSLGPQHSFPLESLYELVKPEALDDVLTQASIQAPVFGTRWRWNATRALVLERMRNGKKVPPFLQRMRADDLLAAVFPAQLGCQDNHGGVMRDALEVPDHPLVRETVRDCLTEFMDLEGLRAVLVGIRDGSILAQTRETPEPSVFSHEILNANPYAFLDDAPLEERRTRAVSLRRGLPPEIVERDGGLDVSVIQRVIEEAAPVVRDAEELHDLMLEWIVVSDADVNRLGRAADARTLVAAGRAALMPCGWVATERLAVAQAAFGVGEAGAGGREAAVATLLTGHLRSLGPVTAIQLAQRVGLSVADVDIGLAAVELAGSVVRGTFVLGESQTQWCDRVLLARIHRNMVSTLRKEIEPVVPAEFLRFLCAWHGVTDNHKKHGKDGLRQIIEQLAGFEAAAGTWELGIFASRMSNYDPTWLDELCLSGEIVWGRRSPGTGKGGVIKTAPVTFAFRDDAGAMFRRDGKDSGQDLAEGIGQNARRVLETLQGKGALFAAEVALYVRLLPAEVDAALSELVSRGLVTADAFGAVRAMLAPTHTKSRGPVGRRRPRSVPGGRWSLLSVEGEAQADEAHAVFWAEQLLRRYGVLFRDVLARETGLPPWRDLLRALRLMEMRGQIRGGRFVQSFVGEQFALPEAVEALRAIRRKPPTNELVRLSASDPLNLVGIITPGDRVSSLSKERVFILDGDYVDEAHVARMPTRARGPRAEA